ncbi:MAG TPA: cation diffusion facilitator family transporter [Rubrobacteraceae bacterium]|nr:cation diffusion facilitator family transporter [Rubrobacteraceae bacterium]
MKKPHPSDHKDGMWTKLREELSHLVPFLDSGHTHEGAESVDVALASSADGIRALKLSLVGLMLTALLQAVIVFASGSVALLADTIHNFGDALTSLPLWIAFALSRKAANRSYTYGYGRAEDLAGVAIVGVIFFSACVAGYESISKLIDGSQVSRLGWVAAAAVVGFLGNEIVARFRIRVGKRIGSAALIADGEHARVDGFTSLAVLVGAGGVALGYPILDPIVGLGITVAILFIVKDSAQAIWRRMMDSIEPEIVEDIERAASETAGVSKVEYVRARWIGHRIHSEVGVQMSGGESLAESYEVSRHIRETAQRMVPKLERLTVEMSPASR